MGETVVPKQKFYTIGDKEEFDPEKWISSTPNELPKRDPETHVNVLIVGAGFAGLMTALECWRKGHNIVGILERNEGPNYSGLSSLSSMQKHMKKGKKLIKTIYNGIYRRSHYHPAFSHFCLSPLA